MRNVVWRWSDAPKRRPGSIAGPLPISDVKALERQLDDKNTDDRADRLRSSRSPSERSPRRSRPSASTACWRSWSHAERGSWGCAWCWAHRRWRCCGWSCARCCGLLAVGLVAGACAAYWLSGYQCGQRLSDASRCVDWRHGCCRAWCWVALTASTTFLRGALVPSSRLPRCDARLQVSLNLRRPQTKKTPIHCCG